MKKKASSEQSLMHSPPSEAQTAYVTALKIREQRIILIRILLLIALIAAWEIGARSGALNAFVFSSPWRMTKTFWNMAVDGTLFLHIGITLGETLLSFLITMLIGVVIAVLLWCSRRSRRSCP